MTPGSFGRCATIHDTLVLFWFWFFLPCLASFSVNSG
ncbi:MAG: hypothetical protein ACI9MB_004646, partial [Verrucomicrobiales bacterium]